MTLARNVGQPSFVVGALAGAIVALAQVLNTAAWPAFLTWTACAIWKSERPRGLKFVILYSTGIALGAMAAASGSLGKSTGLPVATAAAVALSCCAVAAANRLLNSPHLAGCIFLGMISWFASGPGNLAETAMLIGFGSLGLVAMKIEDALALQGTAP